MDTSCLWSKWQGSFSTSLRGFFRSLLSDFVSEKDPIQECHKLVEERRCLVVINDLQSVEEWDLIQAALVSGDSKSIIIVITIEASIAAHCTEKREHIFNIKGLEAWVAYDLSNGRLLTLYSATATTKCIVSHKNPLSPLNDYRNIHDQRKLIMKCGVIAATARLLAIKADEWKDTADSLNHRFMHHLETDPEFNNLRGLFHQMHSIILNPPDFLKPCIFYLLIFPRDTYIQQRRLVRRWIAEGYSKQSVEILVEENAKNLFSELVQLNIFQKIQHFPRTNTTKVFYGVNGFIREYITSRQVEEKLVYELSGDCAITTQTKGRHLIILPSWKRDRIVLESSDFSRLCSLTVFGKWESFFISKSMKLLRVLDLEDALGVNDADLDNMLKLLHCLMLLSLRGCREIYHLPKSLGNLSQLQTLDVKNTSIVTLPASITQLHKLQYVRAGTTNEPLDQGHDAQPAAAHHDITSTSQRSETPSEDVDNEDRASTAVAAPWRRNTSHSLSNTSRKRAFSPEFEDSKNLQTGRSIIRAEHFDILYVFSDICKNKKQRPPQVLDNVNGSGVEVVRAAARRIGNLAALQTLGVVSVSSASGKAILKELKKLIQLRKLRVSGINQKNWKSLNSVISCLVHLESLSVYLDKEEPAAKKFVGDMFSKLPNTLKSLRLYASDGKGQVSPACIKHLDNLRKVHFELTASTQEDIDNLVGLPCQDTIHCLCVKPIQERHVIKDSQACSSSSAHVH
uniref:NB-ARC domain-containing protein n=1 Tax=Aegilops tauschii TaxID=37682 RepID=M8BRM1_AEGTA